jgi:glycerol-3-phosphate dehydrogenase (NAD(P)+)
MGTDNVRIAVLGAGSWGTVFANIIADAADLARDRDPGGRSVEVVLWGRRASVVDAVNQTSENPD